MSISISVFNSSSRKPLANKSIVQKIDNVLEHFKIKKAEINVIFVNDDEIHRINKEFLNHDYPTDVITFPFEDNNLEGEIYISVDTADMQAKEYKVTLTNELMRLAIHGTLHLIGYEDDTKEKKAEMSELEDKFLALN